ncbi:MAG TPA: (2Fe-2S)-binding protein [Burkholderiales bacterium]|nr:(2Fe-2S)-binding protein [Burkholderiales bacterium]
MATTVNLNVNGRARKVSVADPQTPLLWVLRENFGLTGTKFGCGTALCGACTVHVNGEPVRSCNLEVSQAAGKRITTIEGLSRDGSHPVQRAWVAEQVPQCGYCQSGQIMSAVALLAKNKSPSDAEIEKAMLGHICACGTYNRVRKAIHAAAATMRKGA